tara:strand:+ start:103 stop:486 length:384 start_codon:yes stop_codon:yes gene_type:complete
MVKNIEPKDVVVLHPDALKRVKVETELDKKLVDALEWGYAFHPELIKQAKKEESDDEMSIKWPVEDEVAEDILRTVSVFTVPVDLPIAGLAEHLIGFRRLLNSQYMEVKEGDSWRDGANVYLKRVLA